jgi:rRNA biogenesis protein RRP5
MLVDSDLPVVTAFDDAKIGLVVVGVIIKVSEKNLVVEFYNKIRATIPANEAR